MIPCRFHAVLLAAVLVAARAVGAFGGSRAAAAALTRAQHSAQARTLSVHRACRWLFRAMHRWISMASSLQAFCSAGASAGCRLPAPS